MRRFVVRRRLAAALLAVPLTTLAACTDEGPQVEVATVGRATVSEVVEAAATVNARATASVTAPANGTVARLRVADGDQVDQGQVLLTLDSPEADERLAEARRADAEAADAGRVELPPAAVPETRQRSEAAAAATFQDARDAASQVPDPRLRAETLAAVADAEARYAAARRDAAVAVQRLQEGVGSLADALASLAAAQRVQTRAAVAVAERTVESLTVRAPISGVVSLGPSGQGDGTGVGGLLGELPADVGGQASELLGGAIPPQGAERRGALVEGAAVAVGSPLLTVVDVSSLSFVAEVDETDVLLVRPGVVADVAIDAVPGVSYRATVTAVDLTPTVSGRGGVSYPVRLRFDGGTTAEGDPAPRPRPGMSAVADLRVRTARNALAVPASALVRQGGGDAVFVVEAGIARRRPVTVGAEGEVLVQVVRGLEEGTRVVVRGTERVRDGQKVS